MGKLTHFEDGEPRMVDVTQKVPTVRVARAEAVVSLPEPAWRALEEGGVGKGDPLMVAQIAGIAAAKRTSDLIPLCHPLPIGRVKVDVALVAETRQVRITTEVKTKAETGVEMEALTAASVAALAVYDMLKAAAKGIEIGPIRLLYKEGGKSGTWVADEAGS